MYVHRCFVNLAYNLTWLWVEWEILLSWSPTTQNIPLWHSLTALVELVERWLVYWVLQMKRPLSFSLRRGTHDTKLSSSPITVLIIRLAFYKWYENPWVVRVGWNRLSSGPTVELRILRKSSSITFSYHQWIQHTGIGAITVMILPVEGCLILKSQSSVISCL